MMILASRTFTLDDQLAFAALSGDRNPMHLDALFARRTQAGEPVVHGIHAVLWALDAAASAGIAVGGDWMIRFEAFLYLDEEVVAQAHPIDGVANLAIHAGGRRVTSICPVSARSGTPLAAGCPEDVPFEPLDLTLEEALAGRGTMRLPGSDDAVAAAFPALVAQLGARPVRAITALSTLVGMRLPGLHSIFAKCRIALDPANVPIDEALAFQVGRAQPLLRQLTMEVSGAGLSATVDAYLRHPPIRQPSVDELAPAARALEMRGQRILVVGGSRGLGELTSKLTAMAGAEVTLTYARGKADAERVAAEILASGGACSVTQLDVRDRDFERLADGGYTQLYYFATPQIFGRATTTFSEERFAGFVEIYCDGFARLCAALSRERPVKAFWPSSTAIDENVSGSAEYVKAKLAGEALCRELERSNPNLTVVVERFPRLPTDQTSSVIPVKADDAAERLHDVLARMAAPGLRERKR